MVLKEKSNLNNAILKNLKDSDGVYEAENPEAYNEALPIALQSEEKAAEIRKFLMSNLRFLNKEYTKIFTGLDNDYKKDNEWLEIFGKYGNFKSKIVRVTAFEPVGRSIPVIPVKGMGHHIYKQVHCYLSVSGRGGIDKKLCTPEFVNNRRECLKNIESVIQDLLKDFGVSNVSCNFLYGDDVYICDIDLNFDIS